MSNRAAFAFLAVACVTAAGGGAYFATRHNVGSPTQVEAAGSLETPSSPASTAKPVQETEAVVGDSGRVTTTSPASSSSSTTARRREATRETPSRPAQKPSRGAEATTARNGQLPTLERGWPSSQSPTPSSSTQAPAPAVDAPAPVPPVEEPTALEPARAPEPPAAAFEELVVAADSVIGVEVETALSSETARIEDRVDARVVRDVRAGGAVAIPAGSRALGSVTLVERGGKFKERARLGIRFHTLMLADGSRLPISTETIYREGDAPGNETAKRVGGGAIAGTILGAIIGGGKGAAIGATAGAAAGAGTVAAGDRSAATLRPGEPMTVRILSPVVVTLEK